METNLGVSSSLRLLLPAAKHQLNYGRPDQILSERATLELARRLACLSGSFVDVGANEGLFTFSVAADLTSAEQRNIHLFEPDPDLFARLKINLTRNNIPAVANNAALSDHAGRQTFFRNIDDDTSGSLTSFFRKSHETVEVDIETVLLAQYLDTHDLRHTCVKIDVEGAGLAVWSGARDATDRIDWLIMEILALESEVNLPRQIIRDHGWHAWYIRDFDLIRSVDGEFSYTSPFYNWLFTPKATSELAASLKDTRFRIIDAS